MTRFALITAAVLSFAAPLSAQEAEDDPSGMSLMERGAQMFMEGIMREMEPAMEDLKGLAETMGPDLRRFVEEMGPAFGELMGKIDDLSVYHPPEMLPNGDIILRRKVPLDPDAPDQSPLDEGEIEI
ncbi:MAG TPA: hypothetical protein VJ929_08570 [Roseovarius sp.]|nr:hypothetical protein [Roseovarius sp.]